MTTKTKTKKKKSSTRFMNVAPKQNQTVSQVVKIINPVPKPNRRRTYNRAKKEELKPTQSNPIQPLYIPTPQFVQPPQIQSNVYDEAFKKAVLNLLNREAKTEDIKPKAKEEIQEVIEEVREAKPAEIPIILEDAQQSKISDFFKINGKRNLDLSPPEFQTQERNLSQVSPEFSLNLRDLGFVKSEEGTTQKPNQHIRFDESPPQEGGASSSSQMDTPIPRRLFSEVVSSSPENSPESRPFANTSLNSPSLAQTIIKNSSALGPPLSPLKGNESIEDMDARVVRRQRISQEDAKRLIQLSNNVDMLSVESLKKIAKSKNAIIFENKAYLGKVNKALSQKQKAQ